MQKLEFVRELLLLFVQLKMTFKRERFLVVSTTITLFITFLVMGIFVGVVVLTQTGVKQLEEQAQITVFFKDDFSQDKILNLKEGLEKDARILQVTYVSKDNAYKIFSEINRNDPALREAISADILPASVTITSDLAGNIRTAPGVLVTDLVTITSATLRRTTGISLGRSA